MSRLLEATRGTNSSRSPRGGFDFGFALPWNNSSMWLYNAAGVSAGDRANALDYYYLGAFGNNFVDDGEVKRYRNYDSFPGLQDRPDRRKQFREIGSGVQSAADPLRGCGYVGVLSQLGADGDLRRSPRLPIPGQAQSARSKISVSRSTGISRSRCGCP